jgi:hypothetical protein
VEDGLVDLPPHRSQRRLVGAAQRELRGVGPERLDRELAVQDREQLAPVARHASRMLRCGQLWPGGAVVVIAFHTRFGIYMYAIGGSERVARR